MQPPMRPIDQEEREWKELNRKVQLIKERGKFLKKEEVVIYVKWRYGKGRTWIYQNVINFMHWYERPSARGHTIRYLGYEEARKQVEKLMR